MNEKLKKLEKEGMPIKLNDIYESIENAKKELKEQIKLVKHLNHLEKKNSRDHLLDTEEILYNLKRTRSLFKEIAYIIKEDYQGNKN